RISFDATILIEIIIKEHNKTDGSENKKNIETYIRNNYSKTTQKCNVKSAEINKGAHLISYLTDINFRKTTSIL
ncbi:hypothetical protein HHI36_006275, partial [Cryptolaemus montrouzieri]